MSAPEAKNPPTAGLSPSDGVDVDVLFERLRAVLRRGVPAGDARGAEFASVRALAERFWPVTAEREAGGGPKGLVKRALRQLMRWDVEPPAADQRGYNSAVLKRVGAPSPRAPAAAAAEARAPPLPAALGGRPARRRA